MTLHTIPMTRRALNLALASAFCLGLAASPALAARVEKTGVRITGAAGSSAAAPEKPMRTARPTSLDHFIAVLLRKLLIAVCWVRVPIHC